MHKVAVLLLIAFFVVIAVFAALHSYPTLKQLDRRSAPKSPDASSRVYEVSAAAAEEAIRNLFTKNRDALNEKFGRFSLVRAGDPLFPEDSRLGPNEATRQYAAIATDLRKHDLFLHEPTGDYYWYSEYYYANEPVPFRCSFIIHLEPDGEHRTKVEVFEYLPTVWIGKRFDISGHSGPGFYRDIRKVEQTTSDRSELLDLLTKAITSERR